MATYRNISQQTAVEGGGVGGGANPLEFTGILIPVQFSIDLANLKMKLGHKVHIMNLTGDSFQ